jgi:serpin B
MRVARLIVFLTGLTPIFAIAADFNAATATNEVGVEIFRRLGGTKSGGNLIVSPYSIESGLALVYAGADGKTRDEMSQVLHLPPDKAAVQSGFASLRSLLEGVVTKSKEAVQQIRPNGNRQDPIQWQSANRLFGQQGYAFREPFLKTLRDGYDAPFEALDFVHNTEGSRATINQWVAAQTEARIPEIVPRDTLFEDTRLVLVNALYLKAPWKNPFEKTFTREQPFHLADRTTPLIPMMHLATDLAHATFEHASIIVLPYSGDDVEFIIILPDPGFDPASIASKLDGSDLSRLAELAAREREKISLWLPKFKIETSVLRLDPALQEMGMRSAFDQPRGSANFDGIAPRKPDDYLAISKVFHRTFVAVDEEGTEAAAATAVVTRTVTGAAPRSQPLEIRVDRPFLFLIQHRFTGACLFLGRVSDPR